MEHSVAPHTFQYGKGAELIPQKLLDMCISSRRSGPGDLGLVATKWRKRATSIRDLGTQKIFPACGTIEDHAGVGTRMCATDPQQFLHCLHKAATSGLRNFVDRFSDVVSLEKRAEGEDEVEG